MASMGLNLDEQKAVERFRQQVVEPSRDKLVILDFWAEWCGPCKALTPVLEKVAAEYADKGVMLAKLNVDEEQFIAAQFQVRSIPTVYAIFQGQPVADLTPARTEIAAQADARPAAREAAGRGRRRRRSRPTSRRCWRWARKCWPRATASAPPAIFAQIADMAPDNAAVQSG